MSSCAGKLAKEAAASMTERTTRGYTSPLRDNQALRTRDLILDGLTELLIEQRADEISTKQIAARAAVSQPTVYRHFPDRQALLEGLADRIGSSGDLQSADTGLDSIDDLAPKLMAMFEVADAHSVEATAEAILNSDPRRLSRASRERSEDLLRAVQEGFAEYDERDQTRLTALLRCIGSVQTWLRMREEFGVPAADSGPMAAWAIETLVNEARSGTIPELSETDPTS
jgi:AcrR family transcriptional regulator